MIPKEPKEINASQQGQLEIAEYFLRMKNLAREQEEPQGDEGEEEIRGNDGL